MFICVLPRPLQVSSPPGQASTGLALGGSALAFLNL